MRHDDSIIIIRTSQIKNPDTHIAEKTSDTFGPYNGRLGKVNGSTTQGEPGNLIYQNLRIYIPDIKANIKEGDILVLNDTKKYNVGNVYIPNRHHIEVDVIYVGEV